MNDVLISRKNLLDSLRGNVLVDVTPELEKAIEDQPTAFDEEKVIEEIQKEGDIAELHQLNLLYDKKADNEEHFKRMQFELDRGYSVAMFRARKIVEKGGIE